MKNVLLDTLTVRHDYCVEDVAVSNELVFTAMNNCATLDNSKLGTIRVRFQKSETVLTNGISVVVVPRII